MAYRVEPSDARYQKGGDETVLPVIRDKSKATVEKLWPLWEVSDLRDRMLNP